MKNILIIVLAVIASLSAAAQLEKAEFQASGLTCSMCSNAINKALKTVPFIQNVETDLNKNIFSIHFKKNTAIDLDVIRKKVEDAGFSIAKFWIVADFQNVKVQNDEHVKIGGINFHFLNVKSQTLSGEQRMQVLDKNYLPVKEFKKNSVYTSMTCYQTGLMGSCCKEGTLSAGSSTRVFHVTI